MIKNVVYGAIVIALLALGVLFYNPADAPISGVTADDVAASIADNVEAKYDNVIVTPVVTQPDQTSNAVAVQYVFLVNLDPDLFSQQPQTQAEATAQEEAFATLQGSMASLLSLSQEYLTGPNPTVAGISLSVMFLDGQVYQGAVSAKDLNAIPQGATEREWLSVLALNPMALVPQTVWEIIQTLPAVQKLLSNQQG